MPPNLIYEFGGLALESSVPLLGEKLKTESINTSVISITEGEAYYPPERLISKSTFLWADPLKTFSVYFRNECYGLHFPNLASFSIDPAKSHITVYSDTDQATLSHLLLDQVLPRVLAHNGEIILHAGAVSIDGVSFAFIGQSGHGKSSMTASFVQNGAEILSDDALKLDLKSEPPSISGLYPSLRLWPQALDGLNVEHEQTSIMAHYSTKRRITMSSSGTPKKTTHTLNKVFLLQMNEIQSDIQIQPLSDRELMLALVECSFRLDPTDQIRGQRYFKQIDKAKDKIKGYKLTYPRGYEYLPAVRSAIISHLKEVA